MKARENKLQKLLRFGRNESGGTLAELAILVPLLAIMLAAVSEFGRYFQNYTTMAKATRSASRYLSSHPFTTAEQDKAKSLVVCGKLTCAAGEKLITGIGAGNVCIESTGVAPNIQTVTVRIPRTAGGCGAPLNYQPIFNIGALLHTSFSFAPPISPRTTMRYIPTS